MDIQNPLQPPSKPRSVPEGEEDRSVSDHRENALYYTPLVGVTVIAFVSKMSSVGKHRGAVATKPILERDASVSRCPFSVASRKFPLCSPNSLQALQAVSLTVLVR